MGLVLGGCPQVPAETHMGGQHPVLGRPVHYMSTAGRREEIGSMPWTRCSESATSASCDPNHEPRRPKVPPGSREGQAQLVLPRKGWHTAADTGQRWSPLW